MNIGRSLIICTYTSKYRSTYCVWKRVSQTLIHIIRFNILSKQFILNISNGTSVNRIIIFTYLSVVQTWNVWKNNQTIYKCLNERTSPSNAFLRRKPMQQANLFLVKVVEPFMNFNMWRIICMFTLYKHKLIAIKCILIVRSYPDNTGI